MSETNKCFATISLSLILACFLLLAPVQTAHAQSGVGDLGKKFLSVLGGEDSSGTQAGQESAGQKGKTESENGSEGKTTDAEAEQEAQAEPESTKGWIKQIWNFPFFKTGDTWLRVNQLVSALGVLILGGLLASLLSRLLGRLLKRHKKIDQSAATLVQKTTFFFLILLVLVLVIKVANVPLAFLTLILTAVAIGAAIGAKNTIHDYLSGMILVLGRRYIPPGYLAHPEQYSLSYSGVVQRTGNHHRLPAARCPFRFFFATAHPGCAS